jgi:AraC-like DNA-binding protein
MSQIPPSSTNDIPSPLEGAIIQRVALVDMLTCRETKSFQSVSLPGHLLHLVVCGRVEQTVSGICQRLEPGDSIWYYENEHVQGRVLEAPWTFYTVNFLAPTLSPPPFACRVQKAGPAMPAQMKALLETWRDASASPTARHLRVHALLMEIILDLLPKTTHEFRTDSVTQLWWELEAKIRSDMAHPIDMRLLEHIARCSQRTIVRACRLAVGQSPMKRIKELRLSYARGLVQLSEMSMSDIAFRIGYGRVQEFSRDYRRHFGVTPSDDRARGCNCRGDAVE